MDRIGSKDRALIRLSLFLLDEKWLQGNPAIKKIRRILTNKNLLNKKNNNYPKKVI